MNEKQQLPKNDHDLLIRIDERVTKLAEWCTNHTSHHMQYAIAAWISTIGLTVALILELMKK